MLIPEKLIPKLNEIEYNPPKISGFRMSYIKEIVYLICIRKEDDGYSYLKLIYLKKIVPQAEQYIKFLMKEWIIDRTPFYKVGVKSYGYCISEFYSSTYIPFILSDNKLIHRIETLFSQKPLRNCPQSKLIYDLEIVSEAEGFAKNNFSGESLNYALASIIRIINRDPICKFDNTAGRFHSTLTFLHKELRPFIRINGKPLKFNIDIKNSQPYFSTLLLTNPGKVAQFAKDPNLSMILITLVIPDNEDIKLYIELVTTGNFYEYLIPHFEEKGLISALWEQEKKREEVKEMMMKVLYDCNRKKNSKSKQIFAELFPTVNEIFCMIRGNSKGNHFQGFQRFSILLQTIEAYVVLKVILKRIYIECPGLIVFTIHDSVLTTNISTEAIERIMKEELEEFVGYPPVLKVEKIIDSNLCLSSHKEIKERRRKKRWKANEEYFSFGSITIPEPPILIDYQ